MSFRIPKPNWIGWTLTRLGAALEWADPHARWEAQVHFKGISRVFQGIWESWFQFFWGNMVHMGKQLTNSFMIDPSIHLPPILSLAGHSSRECVCRPGGLWQCEAVIGFQQQRHLPSSWESRRIHSWDLSASSFPFSFLNPTRGLPWWSTGWYSAFQTRGVGSIPNRGAKILHPCGHKSKTQREAIL